MVAGVIVEIILFLSQVFTGQNPVIADFLPVTPQSITRDEKYKSIRTVFKSRNTDLIIDYLCSPIRVQVTKNTMEFTCTLMMADQYSPHI